MAALKAPPLRTTTMPMATPPPARSVLLVIDVQASFTARPYWCEDDVPALLAATNHLIQGFSDSGLPTVRVLHHNGPERTDNPFALSSSWVRPLAVNRQDVVC